MWGCGNLKHPLNGRREGGLAWLLWLINVTDAYHIRQHARTSSAFRPLGLSQHPAGYVVLPVGPSDPRHGSIDLPLTEALASARLAYTQVGRIHQLPAQSIPRHAPVLGSRRPAAPQRQRGPGQDDRARLLPAQPLGAAIRGELSAHISWVSPGRQTFWYPAYGHSGMRHFCTADAL